MCKLVSLDPHKTLESVHQNKIKLDKIKKLWYNSCTKKKTKLKKQQEKNT